jgi:multidrug efflux pump
MILSNYAIKFRTAVFVFIIVLVLAGASSYMRLPREGSPDITIPFVFVTAVYDGTAPEEMEKLITVPIEKTINDVEHIKEMRSTSSESVTAIAIEFLAGGDIERAKQQVKDKVDLAKPDLPPDLDEPIVDAFNISSDAPIFHFALSGPVRMGRLKGLAEDLEDQLELLPGVKEVDVAGTREREIRVEIDLPRLIAYAVPLEQVMARIAGENVTLSAGSIEVAGAKFQVRVPGEFALASEMRDIMLTARDGRPVYLTDVAEIRDTFKDAETISRVNGNPSVSLRVKKRSGENSVRLIERVREVIDGFGLPPEVAVTVVFDESDYVDMMIKELENNIVSGFVLVIAVLMLVMGMRNSLFVALAIPLSMLVAFAVMGFRGSSLNMIVLFGLLLAVGMLVDNAIVIVESIYRNHTQGLSRRDAARKGAAEVAWPVITSTLTTLAAFSPLLFWPDIMGQFMSYLPRTLIIVLTASLFVGIVINPAVCSALITVPRTGKLSARKEAWGGRLLAHYERILRGALRHRAPVLLIGFLFLVFSVLAYARFGKGRELFPDVEPRHCVVNLRFPEGAALERTDAALRKIEAILPRYADIAFWQTTIGASQGQGFTGSSEGAHLGGIHVQFLDKEDRAGNSQELIDTLREAVEPIPGAVLTVEKEEEGPPIGAPVTIEVSGDDFDSLRELAGMIKRRIETVPGLVDLQDDLEDALPELRWRIERRRAALLGLDTETIGRFLRAAIYGLETSKFRADEDEFDITVRLPEAQRNTLDLLERVRIPLPGGVSVPLTSVGTVSYTAGRGAISRKDQKRVITITGNTARRGVDKIVDDIRQRLADLRLRRGYAVDYAGDTQEMEESFAFLSRAFAVAVGLILVILVIQFNSAVLPLIIISSVVLSLVGVMWGLLICGMRFGVIMTGVGVISLAGIVVNNAIVLVDCIKQRQAEGLDATEAVVAAGRMRLRPVLLTAVTTILGLIPMAVGWSLEIHHWPPRLAAGAESSAWWAPMAVAVIFGLAVSTVLTLVLVPVMVSVAESCVTPLRRRFGDGD